MSSVNLKFGEENPANTKNHLVQQMPRGCKRLPGKIIDASKFPELSTEEFGYCRICVNKATKNAIGKLEALQLDKTHQIKKMTNIKLQMEKFFVDYKINLSNRY